MRKTEIDRLLENAVAKALGVNLPRVRRTNVRKAQTVGHHGVRRAA